MATRLDSLALIKLFRSVAHCRSKDEGVRRTGIFGTDVQLDFEIVSGTAEKKHGALLLKTASQTSSSFGKVPSDL
jgi:hypothetical protein